MTFQQPLRFKVQFQSQSTQIPSSEYKISPNSSVGSKISEKTNKSVRPFKKLCSK